MRVYALQTAGLGTDTPIPVDLVTASGSGLDTHISIAAAEYQISRIATTHGLSVEVIEALVREHIIERQFEIFGEPRVNVLTLNLALDTLSDRELE